MNKNEILPIVRKWQHPSAWRCAFELGEQRRNAQKLVGELLAYYQKCGGYKSLLAGDDVAKQRHDEVRSEQENSEVIRKAILAESNELLAVKDYCREHAPSILPTIPNVDFFGEPHADYQPLADRMVEVEAAILAVKEVEIADDDDDDDDPCNIAAGYRAGGTMDGKPLTAEEINNFFTVAESTLGRNIGDRPGDKIPDPRSTKRFLYSWKALCRYGSSRAKQPVDVQEKYSEWQSCNRQLCD